VIRYGVRSFEMAVCDGCGCEGLALALPGGYREASRVQRAHGKRKTRRRWVAMCRMGDSPEMLPKANGDWLCPHCEAKA